jgi:deazaflavin-dependent oxidoreductase (nitroreductase family)
VFERDRAVGEQLAEWGKAVLVETRGRVTGRPVVAAASFVEEPDGSLLVAAGSADANWALNLLAEPRCTVTLRGERGEYVAEPLADADYSRAITELILRYGTPAERLGSGPAFALRPATPGVGDPS